MEYYHMTQDKYIRLINDNGLIPRNGDNSQSIGDSKKVVFYSQGKEGAITMFLDFQKHYEEFKGEKGESILQKNKDYSDGKIQLHEKEVEVLKKQVEQINAVRDTEDFQDFVGQGPYIKIEDLEEEQILDPNFNFANSWVTKRIPPENLKVISLRNKESGEVTASKFDIIKYMMSQTTPNNIANKGINKRLANYITDYYRENSEEIARLGNNYEVELISMQDYIDKHIRTELSGQKLGKDCTEQIKDTDGVAQTSADIKKSDTKEFEGQNK